MALLILFFLLQLGVSVRVNSEPTRDKQALLAFISRIPHSNRLQWNASASACNWVGVQCDSSASYVYSLRLPAVGLVGRVPSDTIGRLTQLRVLSLRSNGLTGEIPSDFSNLTFLRSLYLQKNQLSGEFPSILTRLTRLTRLDLSSNNFTGSIPFSVNNLTHLTGLSLENNSFSGKLPSITAKLDKFDVSNNHLNGSIPDTLSGFPESSFAGNIDLCGPPLKPCNPFFPAPVPAPSSISPANPGRKKSKKLSTGAIIAIVVGSVVALLLLLLLLLFCLKRRQRGQSAKPPKPVVAAARAASVEAGTSSSKDDITGGSAEAERNKLVFFDGGIYSFDLEDLLRASAEVLGKGSVGTSYKAVLEEGTTVVVKRLKDVVVTKKEFEMQMEVLGKIKHENVVPLRAFYFSKDEKLLVYDYMSAGSLSALLHGSRGSGRTPFDWDSRMRIALGAARGLACLHVSGKVVHGNIKSSNILLRGPDHYASVSDFGLNPLFGNGAPSNRVGGYRAPEVVETRKVSFKSDVYSFGVLLLELLTGKAPKEASLGEAGIDLPRWVQSVVREEWTAEIFDSELMRFHNIEEEMVQLLQIAMVCVSVLPDRRPDMQDVVRMIEDMNRGKTEEGLRQVIGGSAEAERNKLVFFEGGIYSFDLQDLLRASSEVLGKGSVGTSYKAVLEEGTTVVVKRLNNVVVTKKEFETQMEVLGKIKHENVVPLRAFYLSMDEKLLVYDYMPEGSLFTLLHGSTESTPLDWDSRMRIALGVARGLAYLHVSGKVDHGNIKSSNILLRGPDHHALVSDFGLNPLLGNIAPPNRAVGYRAPEALVTGNLCLESDEYSFGVLLLELLTGNSPKENQGSHRVREEEIDLPGLVQSMVPEESTADFEARRLVIIEEMAQLLKVALDCVSVTPYDRPTMWQVMRRIEDIYRFRHSSHHPFKLTS